jgi:hypothetical protein
LQSIFIYTSLTLGPPYFQYFDKHPAQEIRGKKSNLQSLVSSTAASDPEAAMNSGIE